MATGSASLRLTPYFIYLLATATLGPLLFGYHLAELNAPQQVITCVKKSSNASSTWSKTMGLVVAGSQSSSSSLGLPRCIPMNSTQFGLVTSIFTLGGLIGALGGGPVTTRYGRLKAMLFAAVFAAIGPVIEALAINIGTLTSGRFISGIGAGASTVIVPIFISEIAPPGQKGFFGSATQVMINVGILITQVLGLFLNRGQLWRIILGVGGALAVVQAVGLTLGGQESPKWLADNGKPSKARRILRKLRGHHANIDEEISTWGAQSEHDLEDEEETLLANEDRMNNHASASQQHVNAAGSEGLEAFKPSKAVKKHAVGVFAVIRHRDYAPAVLAVTMIMVAQQLTGINSIIMYGVSLLSGLLAANSALLNVAVAVLNVVITTSAAPLVDRIGRKTCLLASITGMGVTSLLLAVGIMRSIRILSAVAVVLFVASFGIGLGPVPFILSSELVGPEAVGATQSWALAANWIATFVVAQFFPIVNDAMGKGQVYFLFAGFALLFGGLIAWFVPETKGKKDADEVWGRKKSIDRED